jgi:hypothetical protein
LLSELCGYAITIYCRLNVLAACSLWTIPGWGGRSLTSEATSRYSWFPNHAQALDAVDTAEWNFGSIKGIQPLKLRTLIFMIALKSWALTFMIELHSTLSSDNKLLFPFNVDIYSSWMFCLYR